MIVSRPLNRNSLHICCQFKNPERCVPFVTRWPPKIMMDVWNAGVSSGWSSTLAGSNTTSLYFSNRTRTTIIEELKGCVDLESRG
jgi:hypothetical protein